MISLAKKLGKISMVLTMVFFLMDGPPGVGGAGVTRYHQAAESR